MDEQEDPFFHKQKSDVSKENNIFLPPIKEAGTSIQGLPSSFTP
jgi:hypothetical protein